MADNIYELIGLIFVICLGVFLVLIAAGHLNRVSQDSYYRGIMQQLADAVAEIDIHYKRDELMSAGATLRIFRSLLNRHQPNVQMIKIDDEYKRSNPVSASNNGNGE